MQSKIISEKDAAAMLNIHVNSLRRLRYEGKSPRYIEIGKRIFYDPKDVDAFIEQQKKGGK